MKKKVLIFVDKVIKETDFAIKQKLQAEGYVAIVADGNFKKGFEDSCTAVAILGDFPHIKDWAESSGIEVLNFDAPKQEIATKEPEQEVEHQEEAPKRGRKPKALEGEE